MGRGEVAFGERESSTLLFKEPRKWQALTGGRKGGIFFSPNIAKSVLINGCKTLLNMQSPTQAANENVSVWIGFSYYYFATFPGVRSKEGSLLHYR